MKHPDVGIYRGIPSAEYHAWPLASASRLKTLDALTPAHLKWEIDHPKDTPQMRLGSAFHALVLEPERFRDLFAWESPVNPKNDNEPYGADTKAFKAWESEQVGKTCISRKQYETALAMANAVVKHPDASRLLRLCPEREVSCVARMHGSLVKARLDAFGEGVAMDLKLSGRGAGQLAFERAIGQYGYALQCAVYWNVLAALDRNITDFVFVAVEDKPPYGVAVYRMRNDVVDAVEQKLPKLLERYYDCMGSGVWPCYPEGVVDIGLAPWMMKQVLEEIEGETYG